MEALMDNPRQDWDREGDLATIIDAYEQYEREERSELWRLDQPGYGRAALDSLELMVAAVRAAADGGATLLDVGCGHGDTLGHLIDAHVRVDWTGIDLRPSAINAARGRFPGEHFEVASADRMPFDDASFDMAIAKVLFSSLPSWELEVAVSREIERILRPGGSLIWLDLRYPNPRNSSVHAMPRERIRRLFPDWDMSLRTTGLLPPIARRLGRLTSLLYVPLHAFPPLRSHLVGRLVRP